jgi:hypothetical protein
MSENSIHIEERYRGPWCDGARARSVHEQLDESMYIDPYDRRLPEQWAEALLNGDLKSAHKLWGKWQGFTGQDPWEDRGWRNFWEVQKFGEKLWTGFDASSDDDKLVLNTFISYWPGADSE